MAGHRGEDARPGPVDCRAAWPGHRGRAPEGTLVFSGEEMRLSARQQQGVDKMFWLEPGPLSAPTTSIVYLCRPLIAHARSIAGTSTRHPRARRMFTRLPDQIKRHARDGQRHAYTVLLVPRVSALMKRVLEEEGVLGEVTLGALPLQLLPLADDVLSLEADNAFRAIWAVRRPRPRPCRLGPEARGRTATRARCSTPRRRSSRCSASSARSRASSARATTRRCVLRAPGGVRTPAEARAAPDPAAHARRGGRAEERVGADRRARRARPARGHDQPAPHAAHVRGPDRRARRHPARCVCAHALTHAHAHAPTQRTCSCPRRSSRPRRRPPRVRAARCRR